MSEQRIITKAQRLMDKWDACNPGPGCSWDDCCDDIKSEIEELRLALKGE